MPSSTFFGRTAYQIHNQHLSLTLVPAFSARVLELNYRGHNCLWVNERLLRGEIGGDPTFGNWLNWGGYKTWLAPQDKWPDPLAPSLEMDNSEWEVLSDSETEIELIGPLIPWAGVRLGRRLSLAADAARVLVTESIQNAIDSDCTCSVWAVMQLPVPGWATYPLEGNRRTLVPPAQAFDGDRLRFVGDSKWKVGAFTREGSGQYQADAWDFTLQAKFPVHYHLPHPDLCTLETWSNSDPGYMELEWMGPSLTLQPGQRWEWATEWVLG